MEGQVVIAAINDLGIPLLLNTGASYVDLRPWLGPFAVLEEMTEEECYRCILSAPTYGCTLLTHIPALSAHKIKA